MSTPIDTIGNGDASLGIEFGSTRIKAVLVNQEGTPLATGSHDWESSLESGRWSYPEAQIWEGLQSAFADLAGDVRSKYCIPLQRIASLGISAMMHGYIALDSDGELLVPFRTWRNTNTGEATEVLSKELKFNIPHRWSVAHLYQAFLDQEEHLSQVSHICTLASLVHERLTGQFVTGVGDASGMFPIDPITHNYDQKRMAGLAKLMENSELTTPVSQLFPKVLSAGDPAGTLSVEGAALLDPSRTLVPGASLCPPEGDAGTGMVATNSVAPRTGNVSAGTSIFAMVVLESELSRVHPELDMVTTPDGAPVAMVHSNNGASEWDQWVGVFSELLEASGATFSKSALYDLVYAKALEGAADGGGLVSYNFLSGEPVVGLEAGRPLFFRLPDSSITLANFMRAQLMSIFGVLRLGMDILIDEEGVQLDSLFAHGGLFKTPVVAQRLMAAALKTPVEVGETAGEGGPWGMALLALYARSYADQMSLPDFLSQKVFAQGLTTRIDPVPSDVEGFETFLGRYRAAIPAVDAAAQNS